MASKIALQLLYHFSTFTFYMYTEYNPIVIPGSNLIYGGRYKYLTVLNIFLSIFYFGYATLVDLKDLVVNKGKLQRKKKTDRSREIRDYIFLGVLFPVSLTVSILFWGIYAIEPDLMLPALKRKYMHPYGFYNQAIHTGPIVTSLLETLITFHMPSVSFVKGCIGWVLYAATYLMWIMWVAYRGNFWVYPFLRGMNIVQRVLFFACAFLFGSALHKIAVLLTCWWWKVELKQTKKIH